MAVQPDGAILLLRVQFLPFTKGQTRLEAGTQSHGPPNTEVAGLPKGGRTTCIRTTPVYKHV